MPETSQIAAGITRAFREVDPVAAEAGRRWGREIQRGLGDAKVELKADTTKAKAEIDAAAKDKKATVEVDADTAKANAQIDVVARDRKATIEVDADTLNSSWQRSLSQMAPEMTQTLSNAGAQASTSVGGSMSGAMGPVGTALTAALVGGAVTAAAGVAAAMSGAIGLIPAGLGGGIGVIGTLVTGLDGVKDAWDAAGKAADSATKDQAEKAKSVASAQRSLRNAVLDEANAQKDVANARRDARQQLEDLNVQLRGGVIDEKQAILDAQAARRDLATGRFRDAIEYQQAQLRVQQADQRVLEAHERNVQLQQKAAEANAKGVNQADQVVAANQRLAKAQEDVGVAQQNLHDAQSKSSSSLDAFTQAMGKLSPQAQGFILTLRGLKPAWDALKFSVQDSLFAGLGPQVQRLATEYFPVLQRMMTSLGRTMNTAFKDIGAWLSKPETMAAIQQIVSNIGSSFQIWAQSIVPFSNAFLTITKVGSGFLPQLATAITNGANAFNNFIQQAAKSGQLQEWMRTGIQALGEFMKLLPVVGKMFLDLAPIGIPILKSIGMTLTALEPVFRFFGQAVGTSQTFINQFWSAMGRLADKFVDFVKVTWPPVQHVLNTLESVFQRVFGTIANVIERVWRVVKPILDQFRNALGSLDPTGLLGKLGNFFSSGSGGGGTPAVAGGDGASLPTLSSLRGGLQTPLPGTPLPKLSDLRPGPRPWLLNDPLAPGASATSPGAAPSGFNWDAVAQAESSGNWSNADTGHNGHYGGLQFSPATWAAYGGLQFASRPDLATPEQQKIVADRTAFYGWQGTPPQGLGAWETITKGMVPGITTSSQPPAGGAPSASIPGASATLPGGIPGLNLSIPGKAPEEHLQPGAVTLNRIISQLFPDVSSIGGWRAHDPFPDHPSGRALDIMVGANKALGDQINQFLQKNAAALGIQYTLWQQQEWDPGKGPTPMEDRGSPTQNHRDHVHAMIRAGVLPDVNGIVYPSATMPTIASPGGISPDGTYPLGTQNSPFYVMPAQGSSGGEQLGQDFVSGILEIFGIDGSVFKNPMDTGLFKGFKGLMSFLTGGGKGQQQGMPASYWQGAGGGAMPAMGGGDLFAGMGGMLQGIMPQPFGQIRPGGPAQAPDEFQPMLPGSGGNASLPGGFTPSGNKTVGGPQIDQSINIGTINGKPSDIHQTMVDVNVPRARQGVGSIPGMSMP
ncbi:hypothetical protein A5677_16865 [Mycobacterium malmoense]|uniref:Uncharacterized protein n=1 Tax=Mycobacterium malmoense TaxID=1780 RepID=A0A1B9DA73_MYCMA|nr:transglycosylase family protein [Mycobacterium malmoense]OCB57636.1 hypothetical protein A5677_16865 [Mycobacterium malmoense]